MNGAALLIFIAQLPLLLGLAPGSALSLAGLHHARPAALALGAATVGGIVLCRHRWPKLPAPLLALAAGSAVCALLGAFGTPPDVGATVGAMPPAWPWQPALAALRPLWEALGANLLKAHAVQLGTTALALAAIGGLESLLDSYSTHAQLTS